MTLAGVWENEYGSRMTLSARADGGFAGVYRSTTGSTGEYAVVACQAGAAATAQGGQPVALAIGWRSLVDGPGDPSWNWASAMGGQISLIDGREAMILHHLMIATSDFAGLCGRGAFIDKLVYRRVAGAAVEEPGLPAAAALHDDPLRGAWASPAGVELDIASVSARGALAGALRVDGQVLALHGFADAFAAGEGLDRRSVTLIACDPSRAMSFAAGGWTDRASGELILQRLTTRAVPPANIYAQTEIESARLSRVPA